MSAIYRAAKGAELMDRACPGWVSRMDVDKFNIADPDTCILGQIFGGYLEGLDALEDYLDVRPFGVKAQADHGFEFDFDVSALQKAWLNEIEIRLN